jgi:hypothetical protein
MSNDWRHMALQKRFLSMVEGLKKPSLTRCNGQALELLVWS